jgi:hypothetical protein
MKSDHAALLLLSPGRRLPADAGDHGQAGQRYLPPQESFARKSGVTRPFAAKYGTEVRSASTSGPASLSWLYPGLLPWLAGPSRRCGPLRVEAVTYSVADPPAC